VAVVTSRIVFSVNSSGITGIARPETDDKNGSPKFFYPVNEENRRKHYQESDKKSGLLKKKPEMMLSGRLKNGRCRDRIEDIIFAGPV
jgi:hypothetical protein